MKNTHIYNELWRGIRDADPTSTKPTDAIALAKWELQNEKVLALIHSSLSDHLCIHIKNTLPAWTVWEQFKKLFDTPPASQRIDLQMKLLSQKLRESCECDVNFFFLINKIVCCWL